MKSLKILIAWLLIIGQPGVLFCDYVMMVLFAGTGNSKVFQMDDNGVISHQYDLILTDRNEPMELCFSPDGRWGLVGYDMTQSKPETHITTVLGINNDRIIHVQETIPNSFDKLVAISPDSKYGVYGQNLNTLRYYSDRTFEDIPTDNDYLAGVYADFSSLNGNLITNSGWPGGEVREFTLLENGETTTTGVVVDISPATAFQGVYVSPDGKTCIALSNDGSKITSLKINPEDGLSIAHQDESIKSGPYDIGFTPDSKLMLVSFYDCDGSHGGELRCFAIDDESKFSLVNSLDLPGCPHGMALTPDGKYAVMCDFRLGDIYFYVVEIGENGELTYLPENDFQYPGFLSALTFVPDPRANGFKLY